MANGLAPPKLAFGVEPSHRRFRLRLARYPHQARALAAALPPGSSLVLDAGSGRGRAPRYFRHLAPEGKRARFVGLERRSEQLERARRHGYELLLRGDLGHPWPFPDRSFAAVLCEQVLEHLEDEGLLIALREMHRVLRPGGAALIGVPVFTSLGRGLEPLWRPLSRLRHRLRGTRGTHAQRFTLERLLELLRGAGLEPETVRAFRLFTLPGSIGEDWRWYYAFQGWLGARFPGLCTEVSVRARRAALP